VRVNQEGIHNNRGKTPQFRKIFPYFRKLRKIDKLPEFRNTLPDFRIIFPDFRSFDIDFFPRFPQFLYLNFSQISAVFSQISAVFFQIPGSFNYVVILCHYPQFEYDDRKCRMTFSKCRPHNRILALQKWHFSNANQHIYIENQ
jgi:hypothetical protein